MKRFCICLILSVVALMHSSCTQDANYVEQRFCDIYELPSDFSEALKYIDSEIVDRKFYAYMQLIVENPQSFYFDFNAIDEARSYIYEQCKLVDSEYKHNTMPEFIVSE